MYGASTVVKNHDIAYFQIDQQGKSCRYQDIMEVYHTIKYAREQ